MGKIFNKTELSRRWLASLLQTEVYGGNCTNFFAGWNSYSI